MIFIIGSSGSQLDDGLDALDAIRQPKRVLAIAQTGQLAKPRPETEWRQVTSRVAQWSGICRWDKTSTMMLDQGKPGYPGRTGTRVVRPRVHVGGRMENRLHTTTEVGRTVTPVAQAAQMRAACLAELRRKADRGDTDCLPWLIRRTARDPRLLTIHVRMVDQAVFGATRFVALRHVAQATAWRAPAKRQHRQHCPGRRQRTVRPATATLRWLLDGWTGGARWAAWLLVIGLDMGFKLDPPNPYSHDEAGDNRAEGTPRVDIPVR
ncbi:hypothetical protein [Bifidobacterium thermophilum]|nr:hypothetical protein [Bifidobacterium thermophilum]MDW8486957.1 hypothetical protein [Bifidobacterium thermophilum]